MKRAILFVVGIIVSVTAVMTLREAAFSTGEEGGTFRGLVIFVNDTVLEVKHGRAERTFQLNDATVVARQGAEAASGDLQVCQAVRVSYTPGEGDQAVRVEILRESYCVR
ncbi:MAG: hypothetical protein JXA20_07680 [Spirochaetes bacterium]|nr:hypothetical protein [Spirochaetota bacterium]